MTLVRSNQSDMNNNFLRTIVINNRTSMRYWSIMLDHAIFIEPDFFDMFINIDNRDNNPSINRYIDMFLMGAFNG